jgi:hypothetical protein
MKSEFLTNQQRVGVIKIDKWLRNSQSSDLTGLVEKSREVLDSILTKGYYTDKEKELLNELRMQYLEDIKSK